MNTLIEREDALQARGRERRRSGGGMSRLKIAWKRSWHKKAAEIAMFGL